MQVLRLLIAAALQEGAIGVGRYNPVDQGRDHRNTRLTQRLYCALGLQNRQLLRRQHEHEAALGRIFQLAAGLMKQAAPGAQGIGNIPAAAVQATELILVWIGQRVSHVTPAAWGQVLQYLAQLG